MYVIGTAGHVDHGKSALIEALTGIHPDRLQEERERGLTIELGFAWMTLPSGREVSIVDVPGHVRFVRHMLAGVGAIDLALFVVAADEGVMPQTREHLEILDLLDVRHAIVALTKTDLAPDEEWLELVEEELREELAPTTLGGAPVRRPPGPPRSAGRRSCAPRPPRARASTRCGRRSTRRWRTRPSRATSAGRASASTACSRCRASARS